jgi:hypothetical protein
LAAHTAFCPQPAPDLHAPFWQTSPKVQPLPSSHGEVLLAKTHPLSASQLSVVHGLPSLQVVAAPALQLPLAHPSPLVQALPSLHAAAELL